MYVTTKEQRAALFNLYQRAPEGRTYLQFRRTVHKSFGTDCLIVRWCGMWIGIERDGYTHS